MRRSPRPSQTTAIQSWRARSAATVGAGAVVSLADRYAAGPQRDQARPRLEVDAGPDGGEFKNLVTDKPLEPGDYQGAFAEVYRLAGLDPDDYRIVDDTVRFSTWQQSARGKNGDRDLVTLYAYRARFQRITQADRDVENIAELVKIAKANARKRPPQKPGQLTRVVVASDAIIGKDVSQGGTQ